MGLLEYRNQVIQALENPTYHWRTVEGMSRDLKFSESLIKNVLSDKDLEDIVIICSKKSSEGKELYTTRKHYQETQSLWNKVLSTLPGRVV